MKNGRSDLSTRLFANFTPNCHFGRLPFIRIAPDQRIAANYRLEHTVPATDTFTDLPITVHLYRLKDD